MKNLVIRLIVLIFVFTVPAHAQNEWRSLIFGDSIIGYSVEGATKIDVNTAKSLHERGVKFFDARSYFSWKQSHIPGAINLQLDKLMERLDKDEEAVFYCGGIDCKLSANASANALTQGYEKVYYFAEGYPGWKSAGYPIEITE